MIGCEDRFGQRFRDLQEKRYRELSRENFIQAWRIVANGVVISYTDPKIEIYGNSWAERMERIFFQHLIDARKNLHSFKFVGYGGEMNAIEFLDYHSKRVGVNLYNAYIELLPPFS